MASDEEALPRKSMAIEPLKDDLSTLSLADLAERIALLEEEIARCRKAIEGKKGAASAADAVFGKP